MIEAGFYILGLVLAMAAITVCPQREGRINVLVSIMFSYVSILCLGAAGALVLNVFRIPITLVSMGILYFIIAAVYLGITIKKKQIQKLFLEKRDVLAAVIVFAIVGGLALYIFTPYIHINYNNAVDPSNHYAMAMKVVREQKLSGMFFTPLYNGMVINLLKWLLPSGWTYKAYILADVFNNAMEFLFFYAVAVVLVKDTKKKWIPLVSSVIYWCGYPLFSYVAGGYAYWGMAAMLVEYVFVLLKEYDENTAERKKLMFFAVFGSFSVAVCYIQFAPGIFLALLGVVIYRAILEQKLKFNRKNITAAVCAAGFIAVCAIVGYYFVFASKGLKIFEVFKLGSMDANALELLILCPVIIAVMYILHDKGEKWNALHIGVFSYMLLQIGMTVLSELGMISTYYLFKSNIVMWFLVFAILLVNGGCLPEEKKKWFKIYGVGLACFLVFSFNGDESGAVSLKHSIYMQNLDVIVNTKFSDNYMSNNGKLYLMEYAMEELDTDTTIPIIVTNERLGAVSWYKGIYEKGKGAVKASWTEEELENRLEQMNAEYFIVFFDDLLYREQLGDYLDTYERVYENEEGFIAKRN